MSHSARAGGAQVPAWSLQLAVYLGTVGAAVGLGGIWRFPCLVGSSGGSAFIFAFVLACLLIAAPMLTAELLIGRYARRSPAQAPGTVARASGRSSNWGAIGVLGLGSVPSFNLWSDWRPLGAIPAFATMDFFGVLDYVSSNLFLPIGALLTSVFVGRRVNRGIVEQQLEESPPWVHRSCVWLLRYVCPLALAGVLVAAFA